MAPPSWVILDTEPLVADADEPQDAGASLPLSLDLAAPPGVTVLTVGPAVFPADPDPRARIDSPAILAADPSGLLLAVAPPPVSERPPARARAYTGPDGVERTVHVGLVPRPAYLVLDLPAGAASRVPDAGDIEDPASVGVIAAPGGGHGHMVVEFQHIIGADEATLVCFSSADGEWTEVAVGNPRPSWIWSFDGVVSHDGRLWWVDRAKGILACDPFDDQPHMAYVPLPKVGGGHRGRHLLRCSYCSQRAAGSRRCVQVSDGKFRCVEMSYARKGGRAPTITMSTLADAETARWTLEWQTSFAEIWADDSYKAAGLPKKAPEVALIHPKNPDVVYFFVKEYLFAVDMRAKRVVECEEHEDGAVSPSGILAWELPPALIAGLPEEISDNDGKEELEAATV